MKVLKRHHLSSSDVKQLDEELHSRLGTCLFELVGRKPSVEIASTEKGDIYLVNKRPALLRIKKQLIPALVYEELTERLPRVVVDSGAVPYVCNGADVMAPGVVKISGSFKEGAVVAVAEERYGKLIALGIALRSSQEISRMQRGKVVRNLHYAGNKIWKTIRELA